jgi:hypothetical protein
MGRTMLVISGGIGFKTITDVVEHFEKNFNFQQNRDMDMLYSEHLTPTELKNTPFETLEGFNFLHGQLFLKGNRKISSIKGIENSKITGLRLENQPEINDLREIVRLSPKTLTYLANDVEFEGGLLSVFKLQNLTQFRTIVIEQTSYFKANVIINRHLKSEEHDMLSCKEELMNQGYKDYAKL